MIFDLIFDRTMSDVSYARSRPDNAEDLRGRYNASDINRVEAAVAHVLGWLRDNGYAAPSISFRDTWGDGDVFDKANYHRYVGNIRQLVTHWYVYNTTPTPPDAARSIDFRMANDIEQNLYDMLDLQRKHPHTMRHTGMPSAGQTGGLFL